jgi:hypothetical protein
MTDNIPEDLNPIAHSHITAPHPVVPAPAAVNPLLQRMVLPGETFALPSRGVFYNNGELASGVEGAEVHVHPMTVIDEITIKTPDKLFTGDAIREVFGRCIPQILKPDQLLAKDVDYLMLCLRKVSYGGEMEFKHKHIGCKHGETDAETGVITFKSHSYMIEINQFIQGSKQIDPTTIERVFVATLPNGQQVHMNPIRFKDFMTMMQSQEADSAMSPEQQMGSLLDSLATVITSVDEITDTAFIREWLALLTPEYLKVLNTKLHEGVEWGPEFVYKVACRDCGETLEVVAPQNPLAFFS